jgi:hypothetical protein
VRCLSDLKSDRALVPALLAMIAVLSGCSESPQVSECGSVERVVPNNRFDAQALRRESIGVRCVLEAYEASIPARIRVITRVPIEKAVYSHDVAFDGARFYVHMEGPGSDAIGDLYVIHGVLELTCETLERRPPSYAALDGENVLLVGCAHATLTTLELGFLASGR